MFTHVRSRSGGGAGAKSTPQEMGPTPNLPRPLRNRALQTIIVLKKWQIRPRPLRVYINIPAVAQRECQNPPASAPQPPRAGVNVALRPGHTALYGLITAKTRQKMVSREANDVVRVDVEFKTSYSRCIDVAGRGEKSERRRTWQKVLNCFKILARGQPRLAHVVKTCNTRETHVIIRVPDVIKTLGDAVRRESLGVRHGQSMVIGRVLRVCITGNGVCLAACH